MNTIESLRAITRRAIPLNYYSPGICHLPVPPGSGTGSSTPSSLEFLPVRQKEGPAEVLLTVQADSVLVEWGELSYAFSYVVYRASNPAGPFSLAAANVLVTSFIDGPLPPGDYYYKVTAIEPDFGETTASPVTGPVTVV